MKVVEVKREIDLGDPIKVGERQLYVVIERSLIKTWDGNVFGVLVSPIFIVIYELEQRYAFSLLEGKWVDLEDLFLENPSLKEKLALNKS